MTKFMSAENLPIYSIRSIFSPLAYWSSWFSEMVRPSSETVHYILTHYGWLWGIVNNVGFIRDAFISSVFRSKSHIMISSLATLANCYIIKIYELRAIVISV